jgi:hypothetical protein
MRWSDIPFRPTNRTLRQFAGLWLVIFGSAAAWQAWEGRDTAALVLAALAVTVGPLGLAWPRLLRPVFVGWMVLAWPVGWVVSRLVLACLFYGLFTPLGLLFRALGRDVLALRRRPGQTTYWAPKPMPADPRRYLRQF